MRGVEFPPGAAKAPGTITEFVAQELRNRIVLGVLPPGAKVPVYELAAELEVSRVPLREAVRQLEAESLVENLPRRGTVVRELSVRDLRDAFEILQRIEPIAARRAAAPENAGVVDAMEFWLRKMQELSDRKVPLVSPEMLEAHREFHFALFRAGGEGVLQTHLCILWNTCERYVMSSLPDLDRQAAAAAEHAELVRRIRAGDADGATEVLAAHLTASLTSSLRYLESDDETDG
ncbi:GntR family transcriptional regulator [Amycolatopsis silviterrae]|uniref:GntR family transcriptional regulator n=1 Tax=Amycolatopsis silviterrae TaxID=1656914 RepID=A0ABW5HHH5_9PSEU